MFDKAIALALMQILKTELRSDDIAKINKGEDQEAVGEYSYTLEYNGERNGYTKLTITFQKEKAKK